MKIHFTASIVGKRQYLPLYRKIVDHLKKLGHTVQADHILNTTESQIQLHTKEERIAFQKKLENWIQKADVMVVETSFPSISVGYEISLALQNRKPVLILYSEGDAPSLFEYHTDQKVVCEKYTPDTVDGIIDDFLSYAADSQDTRFTFFITPEITAFLEKVSTEQKIPKSVYLRKLIEAEMNA